MGKRIELVCVTGDNNNKIYVLESNPDGVTWTATWGRVGGHMSTKVYPMSEWDKKYRDKTTRTGRERYQDITALKTTVTAKGFKDLTDREFQSLLNTLQGYSKQSIIDNYTVTAEAVTQAQVDKAQEILNQIVPLLTPKTFSRPAIDNLLTQLYTVLPRKMKNVKFHILNGDGDLAKANEIIKNEQDLVDNMASQVRLNVNETTGEQKTLEEALGIKLDKVTPDEVAEIKKLLGANAHQYKKAFKVVNIHTQKKFDEHKEKKAVKPYTRLLWHGSRNANWLSIIQKGLMIRPTGVVLTGAMWGYGLYFADKAKKSIGYTSLKDSYWARGNANQAFIALYEVNTGIEYRTKTREYWMSTLTETGLKQKGQYDSLFAEGGVDLINNEYIVYNDAQCTIKYLIEIGA